MSSEGVTLANINLGNTWSSFLPPKLKRQRYPSSKQIETVCWFVSCLSPEPNQKLGGFFCRAWKMGGILCENTAIFQIYSLSLHDTSRILSHFSITISGDDAPRKRRPQPASPVPQLGPHGTPLGACSTCLRCIPTGPLGISQRAGTTSRAMTWTGTPRPFWSWIKWIATNEEGVNIFHVWRTRVNIWKVDVWQKMDGHTLLYVYVYIYMYMYVCMYGCMYVCMYACMYVCMYGCMDVWMYGCMDVWMYGCMDVWMYVCMYACMYVCMYGCMDVWMYGCMDVCMYVCMYVWMYGCMDVWMYGCMDVWMYGCMDVWMYVCMYGCMDVCMYVFIYIYIYIFLPVNTDISISK